MKKFFLFLLSALAVTVSLTGCHREVDAPAPRRSMADLQYANVPITLGDRMETGTTKASAGDSEWIATYDSFENDLCPDTKSSVDIDSVEKFVKATLFAIIYDHGNFIGNSYIETTTKSFDWRLPYGQDLEIVIYTIVNYGDLDLSYWKQLADDDSLYEEEFLDGNGPVFECASSSALKALEGSDKGLPMAGITRIEDPEASDPLTIKVKRLFAKYNIYFDDSYLQSLGYSVQILHLYACKTNTVCPFFEEGYGVGNNTAGLSQLKSIDFGSSTDLVEANEFSSSHAVTLYFLENCQGDKSGATRWDNVMENVSGTEYMSYIDVGVKVTSATGHDRNYNYRIYLGTDCTTNFDVIRNRFYTIKVRLTDHDQEGFKFTNPNTLSVAAGETIEVPFETTLDQRDFDFWVNDDSGSSASGFSCRVKPNSFKANSRHLTGYPNEGICVITAADDVNEGTYSLMGGDDTLFDKEALYVLDPLVLDFVPYSYDCVHEEMRPITDTDGLVPGWYKFRSELGPGLKDFYDSHLSDVTITGGSGNACVDGYAGHYVSTLTENGKDYLEFGFTAYQYGTYNLNISVAGFGTDAAYCARINKDPKIAVYDKDTQEFQNNRIVVSLTGREKRLWFCYANTHNELVSYDPRDAQLDDLLDLIELEDGREDLTGWDYVTPLTVSSLSSNGDSYVELVTYLDGIPQYVEEAFLQAVGATGSANEYVSLIYGGNSVEIGLRNPLRSGTSSFFADVVDVNYFYGWQEPREAVFDFKSTSDAATALQLQGDQVSEDLKFSLTKLSGNFGSARSGGWARCYLVRDQYGQAILHYWNDPNLQYYGVVQVNAMVCNDPSGDCISVPDSYINLARKFYVYCDLKIDQYASDPSTSYGQIRYKIKSDYSDYEQDVDLGVAFSDIVHLKSSSYISEQIDNAFYTPSVLYNSFQSSSPTCFDLISHDEYDRYGYLGSGHELPFILGFNGTLARDAQELDNLTYPSYDGYQGYYYHVMASKELWLVSISSASYGSWHTVSVGGDYDYDYSNGEYTIVYSSRINTGSNTWNMNGINWAVITQKLAPAFEIASDWGSADLMRSTIFEFNFTRNSSNGLFWGNSVAELKSGSLSTSGFNYTLQNRDANTFAELHYGY